MADSKISALTPNSAPAGTDEFPTNQGGSNVKTTLTQINAYVEPLCNANTATQNNAGGTDGYVTGSGIVVPVTRLQAKSFYRCTIEVSKTAAGTATPIVNLRYGTGGSTSDASLGSFTSTAQTAAADDGMIEVWGLFYSVGSGTSAVVRSAFRITHNLATTGLANKAIASGTAVSSGFNSTPAGSIIGVSVNPGASANWTYNLVAAELINLT